jgi:hypothetical protein
MSTNTFLSQRGHVRVERTATKSSNEPASAFAASVRTRDNWNRGGQKGRPTFLLYFSFRFLFLLFIVISPSPPPPFAIHIPLNKSNPSADRQWNGFHTTAGCPCRRGTARIPSRPFPGAMRPRTCAEQYVSRPRRRMCQPKRLSLRSLTHAL